MKRKKTKVVKIGNIKIGGKNPVVIQGMAKVPTEDYLSCIRQIKKMREAGCEAARVAVKNMEAAAAIKKIKSKIKIPLVADIHFDYRL
ncbi:MAG: flavodoxin-dependent (E)-4-hydroxy-3-methylbut-2-enyl-diphosphate synthase, partial [Candidatus Omnitrophica bacterium]|nr:flavodoxin-dependent (E)-4-hydroxy-3-methylbut-2-enyl-diphosphate synthase [Candidatus Omnitrophota bacterium]